MSSLPTINNKIILIIISTLIGIIYFIRANYTFLIQDDLLYAFFLDKNSALYFTNMKEFSSIEFDNILEILPSQINHYLYTNGRFVCHCIVQLFNGFLPQWTYAIFISICYIALILFIPFFKYSPSNYVEKTFITFILIWFTFPNYIIPCIGIGYIFSALLVLLFFHLIIKEKQIPLLGGIFFALLAGNTNESITIGVTASLMYYLYKEKKNHILIICFIIGTIILCFAPGNLRRFAIATNDNYNIILFLKIKIHLLYTILINLKCFYIWLFVYVYLYIKKDKLIFKNNLLFIIPIIISLFFSLSIGYINSRQFFSIELFSIIMLTNCDFFTNQAKKIASYSILLFSIHIIMVTFQTFSTYSQNERILKKYLNISTGIVHTNHQQTCPFTNKYIVTFDNITTWEKACIKYYYKKKNDIQLIYSNDE